MTPRSRRIVLAVASAAVAAAVLAIGLVLALDDDAPASGMNSAASSGAAPSAVKPRAAPSLEGEDPVTGRIVRLADYSGKPVVINVWASWCPGCNEEAEDLRVFAERHPEAVVLGLDFQDTVEGARGFYAQWKWKHPSIADQAGTRTAKLGLVGLPTTYFLDARHRIVAQITGATDLDGFEQGLDVAKSS